MIKTPKILLLSRSMPPSITGSSIIVSNLAKQFTEDEMIVLGSYAMGRPKLDWHHGWPKLRYASFQPPNSLRGERWLRWVQLPIIFARLIWILYIEQCDLLFTIYPDMIYLLIGYVGSVLTRKPLIVYFHNTLVEAKPQSKFARWLQPRVFKRAKHVFVMSDGIQNLYARKYPEVVCSPLRHSFNEPIPLFENIEQNLQETHTPLRLAFGGSINTSNFGAVKTLGHVMRKFPNTELTLYTGTPKNELDELGLTHPQIEIKLVSRDLIIHKLSEADVLLLPHGFTTSITDDETRTIFPTNAERDRISKINT